MKNVHEPTYSFLFLVIGLIIIWIAPLVVKNLVGATDVCGW